MKKGSLRARVNKLVASAERRNARILQTQERLEKLLERTRAKYCDALSRGCDADEELILKLVELIEAADPE